MTKQEAELDARFPLRMPSRTHSTCKVIARALDLSMNDLILRAIHREIENITEEGGEVMERVQETILEQREMLGGLETLIATKPRKSTKTRKRPKKRTS